MNNVQKTNDNEVYILGLKEKPKKWFLQKKWWFALLGIPAIVIIILFVLLNNNNNKEVEYFFEPETSNNAISLPNSDTTEVEHGFIETSKIIVNDVPLIIYIPNNAVLSLAIGKPDKTDSKTVFVAQAADIRADNYDIVGEFVLEGKQLAHGTAKKGFCAIVDGTVTIGFGVKTPLLQNAIETGGYFFRQYPLVSDGVIIENKLKNKSIRRALAIKNNQAMMFETVSAESFYDFSQALIDFGVSNAIYLVGSSAYGWYYDGAQQFHEFGIENERMPKNTSYIVWKSLK